MHNSLNRQRLVTCSIRICVGTSFAALAVTVACAEFGIPPERRLLTLMTFLWLIAMAMVSGVGALVGMSQVSTAEAFRAGLRTGMTLDNPEPTSPRLQLVE